MNAVLRRALTSKHHDNVADFMLNKTDVVPRMFDSEADPRAALITHTRDMHLQGKKVKFHKSVTSNAVRYVCNITNIVFLTFHPDFLKSQDDI